MEIKRLPEDFQVEELSDVRPSTGDFALYRLTKRWIGTPEAVDAVLRTWNVARRRVSYGGMKDFHAITRQYLTIHRGPQRDFKAARFHLEYLGQTKFAFSSGDIRGNRFQIVVRNLDDSDVAHLDTAITQLAHDGIPNYFDEQRFGSVGASGDFIARPWVLGDFERALWLALVDPNEHDTPAEAKEKRTLEKNWGRWTEAKAALGRSHRRSLVTFLVDHPADFRGAFGRLRVDMRRLYLSAFQSYLWNEVAAAYLRENLQEGQFWMLPLRFGPAPYHHGLAEQQLSALRAVTLPYPSSRATPEESQRPLYDAVLGRFGLKLEQMRVKYPRDCFFSRGGRRLIESVEFHGSQTDADEVYPGRMKLQLAFDLPRGAYATIALKRLAASVP